MTQLNLKELYAAAMDVVPRTRQRLIILSRLGALDRFRPSVPLGEGTAPFHYVLGPGGAAVLAAAETTEDIDCRRDRAFGIAFITWICRRCRGSGAGGRIVGVQQHDLRMSSSVSTTCARP